MKKARLMGCLTSSMVAPMRPPRTRSGSEAKLDLVLHGDKHSANTLVPPQIDIDDRFDVRHYLVTVQFHHNVSFRVMSFRVALSPVLLAGALVLSRLAAAADANETKLPPAATRAIDFGKDIQPIFEKNCYGCHGSKKQEAAFRLDQKDVALKGGEL